MKGYIFHRMNGSTMKEAALAVLCVEAKSGGLNYSHHHARRIFQRGVPDRLHIRYVLCDDEPEIIEHNIGDEDSRGESCLIWGIIESNRVAHVLCSYPPNPVVITAYWPDIEPSEWEDNFKRRVQR